MPPFAGPGNGGWTTEGGPIMTLKGEEIHIFLLPTGVRPGTILETGQIFRLAGHIMPTLDSQVAWTATAPGGAQHTGGGQANAIGYFYDPDDDFVVTEPGLWSVDVWVWHEGQCSGGATIAPFPTGDVLGSEKGSWSGGRYWFYAVDPDSPRLPVVTPSPGYLDFEGEITPVAISGLVPPGLTGVTIDYTIGMPGVILKHGQIVPQNGAFLITYDPVSLHQQFPNLDLTGRDDWSPGLADTVSIGLLLQGSLAGQPVYQANTVTLQGERVYVGASEIEYSERVYLPVLLKAHRAAFGSRD
jgi:hypothetical protein